LRFAKERGPGQTIVTILCDSGYKYQSRLFNPAWLSEHALDPDRTIESALEEGRPKPTGAFVFQKESATSGKAGGLSEGERLKAAWPFGR